jgi:hypothetical protein
MPPVSDLLPQMRPHLLLSSLPNNTIILWIHHRIDPFIRWKPLWSNHLWKHHYRHPHKCAFLISWVILSPFRLTIKINHHMFPCQVGTKHITLSHKFYSWPPKAHVHLIMQNAFSITPWVTLVLTVLTFFKSSKSLLRLKANS